MRLTQSGRGWMSDCARVPRYDDSAVLSILQLQQSNNLHTRRPGTNGAAQSRKLNCPLAVFRRHLASPHRRHYVCSSLSNPDVFHL